MKLIIFLLITFTTSANAQTTNSYSSIEIYPNSQKTNAASMIFDELHLIGYNKKGQLLYGYTYITEAGDHNSYGISVYDVVKNKTTSLLKIDFEDSLNFYDNFKQYYDSNAVQIQNFIKKYAILKKQPIIKNILAKEYVIKKDCKKLYDWYNCNYIVQYKTSKPFKIKTEGQPNTQAIPQLYKLLSFEKHQIILYNTTQRGWEGTPFVIRFGFF